AAPRDDAARRDEKKVRLQMAVGKRDGIRPADVVGSIANEANVQGKDIGPIEIMEDRTYVTVPLRYRDQIIAAVGHARFRGKAVDMKVADDQSDRPRPAFKKRDDFDGAPARPKPRFGADRDRDSAPPPRRRFGDRDDAAAPRRPRAAAGERPSFTPGARKFGDRDARPSSGAKPYGKPYGKAGGKPGGPPKKHRGK
ncbi:MAG TPA: DbpA RNA binding domain-containing protein, partial [Thermoanaerobaculia bacterium]